MTVKEKLMMAYKNNIANKVTVELEEEEIEVEESNEHTNIGEWPTTWWQQFLILLKRSLKERKHESFDFLKIAQILIVAFLVGLLWWQSTISHLQDQVSLQFCYNIVYRAYFKALTISLTYWLK